MYFIQHSFICRPSDSTVSVHAGIEPKTVATLALTVRRSNHWARSHLQKAISHLILYNYLGNFFDSVKQQQDNFVGTKKNSPDKMTC